MKKEKVVILGGGISGLTIAYLLERIGIDVTVIEKEERVGGLLRSFHEENYIFDQGGHVLHSINLIPTHIFNILQNIEYVKHNRKASIYISNDVIPYPFQYNFFLHSKEEIVRECAEGLQMILDYSTNRAKNQENYTLENYVISNLGYGIYKWFMKPYNEKLWKSKLSDLDFSEMKYFIPMLSRKEIKILLERSKFRLAKNNKRKSFVPINVGYNTEFLYPRYGGIETIVQQLSSNLKKSDIILNSQIVGIDVKKRIVQIKNEGNISYDLLFSTIPLDILAEFIVNVDKSVTNKITESFKPVSVLALGIGVDGASILDVYRKHHWIYVPEKDKVFHRIVIQSNFSEKNAPKNKESIILEISTDYFSTYNIEKIIKKSIKDLTKIKFIERSNVIDIIKPIIIKYAYPKPIKGLNNYREQFEYFLKKKYDIFLSGRFGSWKYMSIAQTINQAYKTFLETKRLF